MFNKRHNIATNVMPHKGCLKSLNLDYGNTLITYLDKKPASGKSSQKRTGCSSMSKSWKLTKLTSRRKVWDTNRFSR